MIGTELRSLQSKHGKAGVSGCSWVASCSRSRFSRFVGAMIALSLHQRKTDLFQFVPSPFGSGQGGVQTGKIVYRINWAHGLHGIGQEEGADAVQGSQCHGPDSTVDSRSGVWRLR